MLSSTLTSLIFSLSTYSFSFFTLPLHLHLLSDIETSFDAKAPFASQHVKRFANFGRRDKEMSIVVVLTLGDSH